MADRGAARGGGCVGWRAERAAQSVGAASRLAGGERCLDALMQNSRSAAMAISISNLMARFPS